MTSNEQTTLTLAQTDRQIDEQKHCCVRATKILKNHKNKQVCHVYGRQQ